MYKGWSFDAKTPGPFARLLTASPLQLQRQYRASAEQYLIASAGIYKSQITSGRVDLTQPITVSVHRAAGGEKVVWLDIDGASQSSTISATSFQNDNQVTAIVDLYRQLQQHTGLDASELASRVAIISPYRGQCEAIAGGLRVLELSHTPTITTSKRAQGSEWDLVIFSVTHSTASRDAYAMSLDAHTSLVSISRHKNALVIVGDFKRYIADVKSACRHYPDGALLEDTQSRNLLSMPGSNQHSLNGTHGTFGNILCIVTIACLQGTSMMNTAAGAITMFVVTIPLSIFGEVSFHHMLRRKPLFILRAAQKAAKTLIVRCSYTLHDSQEIRTRKF